MAERARIELGAREAAAALLFAFIVLGVLAAAASGLFNPMLAGTIITLVVILIFIGNYLVKIGILSRAAMPLWYILVLGIMLVFYGLVSRGAIPLAVASEAMTFTEVVVFTSMLYTIFVVAIIGLATALYYLTVKKKVKIF
jgi:hypothetical protein